MRRSISVCEPAFCLAGQMFTWQFHHTPATTLPKGSRLRLDLLNRGRDIDWMLPSTELKRSSSTIYLTLASGEVIGAKACDHEGSYAYDFILTKEVKSGISFTITLGGYKGSGKDTPESEIAAQTYTQRRRTFNLYIDPKGKTQFAEPEEFHLDVKGNVLHLIRVLTPAFVTRGKRFDVTIRFEDQFGNLTGLAPEDSLIELTYEHLRENLSWKLFVPETGFITLPNLYFNEPGTYRIQLKNSVSDEVSFSAPIRCFNEEAPQLVWGLLHGESEKVDTIEEPEAALRHFRDEACYNYFALSAFSNEEMLTPDQWKILSTQVGEFNEEDRFSAFLGFQWVGSAIKEGIRQVIYSKENRSLCRSDDIKTNSLKKLYKSLTPKESLCIPSFTMSPQFGFDFQEWDPEFDRLVEIYNSWGCNECTHAEGNLFPLSSSPGKVKENIHGSLRAALNAGKRFGFTAGGLDDRGVYKDFFDSKQVQYQPGLTAIMAKQHQRDSLFEALYQRRCYATTGERILLDFMICNFPMGSEISATQKPGLAINRYVHGFVAGTAPVVKIEVIRCGKVWQTIKPAAGISNIEIALDDSSAPSESAIKLGEGGFLYYYLRVTQKDGHIAWSSPIWIDFDKIQLGRISSAPAVKEKEPVKVVKETTKPAKLPKKESKEVSKPSKTAPKSVKSKK